MNWLTMNRVKTTKITNTLALILAATTAPFVIIFYFFSFKLVSLFTFVLILGYLNTFLLNKWQCYTLSRFGLIFYATTALIVYGTLLGVNSSVICIFYPFSWVPIILFDYAEKRYIITAIAITSMGVVGLKTIYNTNIIPPMVISDPALSFISLAIIIASIALAFMFLWLYIKKNQMYENELKQQHALELSSIRKTMVSVAHHVNNLLVLMVTNAQVIHKKSEDEDTRKQALQINKNGYKIAEIIRKISRIKKVKDTNYAQGIQMIDLENSVYEDDPSR
ncbi:MAG: hypothetical protein ACO3K7_06155 [Candidatus Marinamargulisbacteria bacterium]